MPSSNEIGRPAPAEIRRMLIGRELFREVRRERLRRVPANAGTHKPPMAGLLRKHSSLNA